MRRPLGRREARLSRKQREHSARVMLGLFVGLVLLMIPALFATLRMLEARLSPWSALFLPSVIATAVLLGVVAPALDRWLP